MDIVRNKKTSFLRRWFVAAGAAVLALLVLATLYFREPAEVNVERDLIRVAEVLRGDFNIVVRAPGTLVPTDVRWLAAEVGGRVERVRLLPGAVVAEGDIIAELSNPALLQQLDEMRWDLEALGAQHRADNMNMESRVLDQQLAQLNAKNAYESSKMTYTAQLKLRERNLGSISEIDFETIRMETAQREQHWQIEIARSETLQANLQAQENARTAQLNKLEKQLARMAEQVEDLRIRAPMTSVVQEVSIEPGQEIGPGGAIAKLVKQDQLIARILVPETQIHNVVLGQAVTIDTRKTLCEGEVTRVSPSVVEGTVEVDVTFAGVLPQEARPDLTIDAEINVASLVNALYVDRPAFSQSNQAMRIFKLNEEGNRANKVLVEFGRGSASKIEIKSGLNPGDQVIVSDQSGFSEYNVLAL